MWGMRDQHGKKRASDEMPHYSKNKIVRGM